MQRHITSESQVDFIASFIVGVARNKPIEIETNAVLPIPFSVYGIPCEYEIVCNTAFSLPYSARCSFTIANIGFIWQNAHSVAGELKDVILSRGRVMFTRDPTVVTAYQSELWVRGEFISW